MENIFTIYKDFGCVPCGQKTVKTVKIGNQTKKPQVLTVQQRYRAEEILLGRLRIHPETIVAQPKQTVSFKLTYFSGVEGITDNFYYDIVDSEELVAHLYVHAQSVGPSVSPKIINVKFFSFLDVNQTVKNVELTNTGAYDAKFYFDVDDDSKQLEISQTKGVIPAGLKLGLKLAFRPLEQGVFYKKVFCIIQFHEPLIFNILAVYKPKFKLDPKNLTFRYPPELSFSNGYDAYVNTENLEKVPEKLEGEKFQCSRKSFDDLESNDITSTEESEVTKPCWIPSPEASFQSEHIQLTGNVFLTKNYVDVTNSPEVLKATALVNLSKSQIYYYEWDEDPKGHFVIDPSRGLVQPNTKIDFTIYFSPSVMDRLFQVEIDLRVFKCNEEPEENSKQTIDLPLTMRLKLIGHSFEEGRCGWVPQCKIAPKILYLSACVSGEVIYGTFRIEREGHLPVNFVVHPPKDRSFTVQPPLGHLAGDYQIFVVQFNSSSKEPGIYTEDLNIKFNNSNLNIETIRLVTSVELPHVIIGADNSMCFPSIFPGSKASKTVIVENPSNLVLSYEFIIPDDITWLSIPNLKGLIEPKSFDEIEIVYQPEVPCEYLDYVPCIISSVSKPDATETIQLQIIGSCQYGYLVATPSIYDFGQCLYKKEKVIKVHLFNFSSILLFFRLIVVANVKKGDAKRDVKISPTRGKVPPKGSFEIEVKIIPHQVDNFKYDIECQNYRDESEDAEPCEPPRKILSLTFEGVLPTIQILDLKMLNGGPLFSPHWLWQMFCVEKINKALMSLDREHAIKMKIPEVMRNSPPMTVALMLASNEYGQVVWEVKLEIKCPCYLASSENLIEDCLHTKAVILYPTKQKLGPLEKVLVLLKINYNFSDECMIVMTFNMSDKRKLLLLMSLMSLPTEKLSTISTYLSPTFKLHPVLIGDSQPPVQLYWLYNNSDLPASYSVALRESSPLKVFDCINPKGVIPPRSPHPLAIIFSPKELISYSTVLTVNQDSEKVIHIHLSGDGLLNVQRRLEIVIPKTSPQKAYITEKAKVDCSENFVNIDYLRVFSRTKRFFFLQNKSKTDEWSFSWRRSSFENLFSVAVQPEKGVIKPGEKILMTLFVKSFCYPTFVSFSVPCEVYNYSKNRAHEESALLAKLLEERDNEYFTITEKGTEYTKTEVPLASKPKSYYIFITVNANIIGNLNIDEKLDQNQQNSLMAEKEIKSKLNLNSPLKPVMLQDMQELLENILWDVLCSRGIAEKMKNLNKSQDFIYRQLMPENRKKKEEFVRFLMTLPNKHFLQRILEGTMKDIICKKFCLP